MILFAAIHRGRVPIDIKTELYLEAIDHQLKMEQKAQGEENGSATETGEGQGDIELVLSTEGSPPHPVMNAPPENLSPSLDDHNSVPFQNISVNGVLEDTANDNAVDHLEPSVLDAFDIVVPDSPLGSAMDTGSDDQSSKSSFETLSYGQLLSGHTELFPTASHLIDNYNQLETLEEHPEQTEAIDLSVSIANDNTSDNTSDNASQNGAPVSGVWNDNAISDSEFDRLKNLIIVAIKIDSASQLYSSEVLQEVALRTINFIVSFFSGSKYIHMLSKSH